MSSCAWPACGPLVFFLPPETLDQDVERHMEKDLPKGRRLALFYKNHGLFIVNRFDPLRGMQTDGESQVPEGKMVCRRIH